MGCDAPWRPSWALSLSFNPRTRMGCDFAALLPNLYITMFQSTHPHGVRPLERNASMMTHLFQSTHPHGVRPVGQRARLLDFVVSIHAPAWGATSVPCRTSSRSPGFNPRTRMGCDEFDVPLRSCEMMFQSTHPHGVRPLLTATLSTSRSFQSTHPHGVRRIVSSFSCSKLMFQSTHPHGVRLAMLMRNDFGAWVSIHAPAWGATQGQRQGYERHRSFNPRTRMGCDHAGAGRGVHQPAVSIHAPAWGATSTVGPSKT